MVRGEYYENATAMASLSTTSHQTFKRFGDEQVTAVARGLDVAHERVLLRAAE
jgi:hypothetical protein